MRRKISVAIQHAWPKGVKQSKDVCRARVCEASGRALLARTSSLSEEEDFSSHPARLVGGRQARIGCLSNNVRARACEASGRALLRSSSSSSEEEIFSSPAHAWPKSVKQGRDAPSTRDRRGGRVAGPYYEDPPPRVRRRFLVAPRTHGLRLYPAAAYWLKRESAAPAF